MARPGQTYAPQATPTDTYLNDQCRIKNEKDGSSGPESSNEGTLTGYEPRPGLSKPTVLRRTMGEFLTLLMSQDIRLDPEYQRDVVWPGSRMTGLIDSLMENFYVPPIVFNIKESIHEDDGKRRKWICVDGKQRLSSIQAFMEGRIGCHDKNGKLWYYGQRIDEHGNVVKPARSRVLPRHIKEQFSQKELVCYEFLALEAAQEEDCFARVQLGVPLSTAEKARAKNGPWQDFAKLFEEDFAEVVGLSKCDRSRGFLHLLGCFAQILEVQHPSGADGQPILKAAGGSANKLTINPSLLTPEIKSHLAIVFRTFRELVELDPQVFKNNDYNTSKLFAPVELIACSVLISMYHSRRNKSLLLEDIRSMRQTIREQLLDLRLNGATWTVIWQFLKTLEESRDVAGDTPTPTERPYDASHNQMSLSEESGVNDSEPDAATTNSLVHNEILLPKKRLTRFSTSSGRSQSTQIPAFSRPAPVSHTLTISEPNQFNLQPNTLSSISHQPEKRKPIRTLFLERSSPESNDPLGNNHGDDTTPQLPVHSGRIDEPGQGFEITSERTNHPHSASNDLMARSSMGQFHSGRRELHRQNSLVVQRNIMSQITPVQNSATDRRSFAQIMSYDHITQPARNTENQIKAEEGITPLTDLRSGNTSPLRTFDMTSGRETMEQHRERLLARFLTKGNSSSSTVPSPRHPSHSARDSEGTGKNLKRDAVESGSVERLPPPVPKRAKE